MESEATPKPEEPQPTPTKPPKQHLDNKVVVIALILFVLLVAFIGYKTALEGPPQLSAEDTRRMMSGGKK